MTLKTIFSTALVALAAISCCNTPETAIYLDESQPLEKRVEDALSRMTLAEKVNILHAQSKFSSAGVPRLGIPELWTTDGPHGIRPEVKWDEWDQAGWTNDSCTAFPALTCLAATWSEEMAALYGKSIGEEARYREKDVLLGPGVNIYRTPLCGRNFEYMGEDPFLAGRMAVPYIQEVQKNGVAVCVKHFALNNQEAHRHRYNAIVDDRALYEIYLPAFKAAVQEGGAWSIMGAYNLFENEHLCHNDRILNKILKGEWGFDGAVISDWGGTHNTEEAIVNGLDLEMGTGTNGLDSKYGNSYQAYHLASPYYERLQEGKASMEVLDDKVRRVLRLNFRTAMNSKKPYGSLCSPEHYAAARKIASEGIVLLKNENNILPIDLEKTQKILVVGENAIKKMTVGGGSSSLKAQYECTPIVGLREAVGDKAEIVYQRGYVGDLLRKYNNVDTGIDLTDPRSEEELINDAVAEAADADLVIFFGGLNKSRGQDAEGRDRDSMALPYAQDKVIDALAEVNKNIVVVIVSGNAVEMPWIEKVDGVVESWFSGTQTGHALADILLGNVNPSGKLPFTFPVKLEDNAAHALGAYHKDSLTVEYKESIFVGYRWAEKQDIKPLFAFGHGLSYTTFEYGKATCSKSGKGFKVTVDVTNTGDREGKEIVQLYIGDQESSLERPVKELKGFKKVAIAPGQTVKVTFDIDQDMLKFYDPAQSGWVLEKGKFTAYVGAASDDIRTTVDFAI